MDSWQMGEKASPTRGATWKPAHTIAIVVAALVALTVVAALVLLRPSGEPSEPATTQDAPKRADIACMEGGGTWVPSLVGLNGGSCEH